MWRKLQRTKFSPISFVMVDRDGVAMGHASSRVLHRYLHPAHETQREAMHRLEQPNGGKGSVSG